MKKMILLITLLLCLTSYAKQTQPNLVLLISDDSSHWDFGCYGSPDSITPNIDKLASEGLRFERCYQAAPMCSPTRHNLYTGIWPVKSGAYPNHTFVMPGNKTIVQRLKPLGYRVALSGKTHIGPKKVFDFEYLGKGKNPDYKAVDVFIEDAKKKKQPFCLFLCSNEPHTPWNKGNPKLFDADKITLPPMIVDTPETRKGFVKYLAEINYLDGQVGQALDLLKKHKLSNNTLFIFTSEQGNSLPFAKWTCYNAGLHTAFIARYPGIIEPGTVSQALIDYSDVVPTFIELAGGEIPEYLDGKSMVPVLTGQSKSHKDYSFGLQTTRGINNGSDYFPIRSVTDGEYRLVLNLSPEATFQNAATRGEIWNSWKVLAARGDAFAKQQVAAYEHRPAMELFNVLEDPYNMNNLMADPKQQERVAALKEALLTWMDACGDKGLGTEMEAKDHQRGAVKKYYQ